jgi:predicted alpha/beta-fold hydrolase
MPVIANIPVPTLMMTARDDPFVSAEPYERLKVPPHVRVEIHDRGGHLGFLGFDGKGGVRWAERRVVEWLLEEKKGGATLFSEEEKKGGATLFSHR